MSAPLFKADVLFSQRLFAVAGFYPASDLDSDWGPKTQAAQDAWDKFYADEAARLGLFDPRTEMAIATLLPVAQTKAREFMNVAKAAAPFVVKILSGTRSYSEQNALFNKRPKVTNAKGGQSNHNFGIAWDAGIFINGQYATGRNAQEERAYDELSRMVMPSVHGIEWGGDWKSFKDKPHYQLATGKSVSECRRLLEQGKPYV